MNTTINPPNGRGCGRRTEDAAYACCGLSPWGIPIENFVIDPAIEWPGKFQRGIKILPRYSQDPDGIKDLVIFVGKKFYQSPWDFVEEAKRFGASRKMSGALPFEQLTPGESRMIFCHSKAIPIFEYESDRDKPYYGCRHFWTDGDFDREAWEHSTPGYHLNKTPCTMALRDLSFLVHGDIEPVETDNSKYMVNMPSFTYVGKYPKIPESYIPTKWKIGLFLALPLTHIEFCRKANPEVKQKAEEAGFETVVMEH